MHDCEGSNTWHVNIVVQLRELYKDKECCKSSHLAILGPNESITLKVLASSPF